MKYSVKEAISPSSRVTNDFKKAFVGVNQAISGSGSKTPKLKAETTSPEEMFDVNAFTNDDIEEQTTTGSVGGSFVGPIGFTPKRMSLFAPKGSKEHEEGRKILKQLEKPIGGIYTKKNLKEMFSSVDDIEEQSTAGSVGGSYVQPSVWAKDRKNWRGNKKQYPGGKFVKPKEKCKNFPYCDEDPNAIELSNTPHDKLDNLFGEGKSFYEMDYDDEIYEKRDGDFIKLKEIILSVNSLVQLPAVNKLWELYQKKFEGYLGDRLIEEIEELLESKYNELTNKTKMDESNESIEKLKKSGKKTNDYEKTLSVLKSVNNQKQFNGALKMWMNLLTIHKDTLTKKQLEDVKNLIHKKIEEIKDVKEEIHENKSVHRKIST